MYIFENDKLRDSDRTKQIDTEIVNFMCEGPGYDEYNDDELDDKG